MGPYRAAGPAAAAATTTRGAGGRRSSAPKSPTQKSPLRLAEGHGGRRGGAGRAAPRRPAASPPPGVRRRGSPAGSASRGARHLPWGAGIILLHKYPRQKGLGGGIRPRCRPPRMRGGAGKGGGSADWRRPPCSVPLPARRGQGAARPPAALGSAPAAGGELSACRSGGAALKSSWRNKKGGRPLARRTFWGACLPQGSSRLMGLQLCSQAKVPSLSKGFAALPALGRDLAMLWDRSDRPWYGGQLQNDPKPLLH